MGEGNEKGCLSIEHALSWEIRADYWVRARHVQKIVLGLKLGLRLGF